MNMAALRIPKTKSKNEVQTENETKIQVDETDSES
jgi:hypothetical protein